MGSDEAPFGRWIAVDHCPACGGHGELLSPIKLRSYPFANVSIPLPSEGVAVATCSKCTLLYKDRVPSPELIGAISEKFQDQLWVNDYNYADEIRLVGDLTGGKPIDVLDVGAAGGEFLDLIPMSGRRSALDIVKFDRLDVSSGEFIKAFLDEPIFEWSGNPYDVVTIFDVLEHLYNPNIMRENISKLTRPGGYVVIETGDATSQTGRDPGRWSYLGVIEHHLAWSEQSLSALFADGLFKIISVERKRHKTATATAGSMAQLRYLLADRVPFAYALLRKAMRWQERLIPAPGKIDHMRVVLRKAG